MKKTIITILATALACFCIVGTTLAFLVDKTDPIVNTFTAGNVDITLTETDMTAERTKSFKMIPGSAITKDPAVTVSSDSEDCWVFVKIEKANGFDDFMTYSITEAANETAGWKRLTSETGSIVYYRLVSGDSAKNTPLYILDGNTVSVKNTVTKAMIDGLTESTLPKLTFTAYAVQYENLTTVGDAWTQAKALDTP